MRHVSLNSLLALSTIVVAPMRAQSLELPSRTIEQRWDRASRQVTLFALVFVREGMRIGRSPAESGRELATYFGPWSAVVTPADMARTIHRNWQLWRDVEFVATEVADSAITITASRPYLAAIQQYSLIGVSPADFDAMFGAFHQAIASQQGLEFRQVVDSASVRMSIRRAR